MEILRDVINNDFMNTIKGHYYGCIEELMKKSNLYKGKTVLKGAEGAKSSSVCLGDGPSDVVKKAHVMSQSNDLLLDIWDLDVRLNIRVMFEILGTDGNSLHRILSRFEE